MSFLIPVGVRPTKDVSTFMDFLVGVGHWEQLTPIDAKLYGPRKVIRFARSKFLRAACSNWGWDKRRVRAFRRETWASWLRASVAIEIDRYRFQRACKYPRAVPWEDVLFVRRKFNYDPISKRAVHE